jgi:uncharacterized Zn-binding protein involved in type VI secretion
LGDSLKCVPNFDAITGGEPTVLIGYQPAARIGDPTDGGVIVEGFPSVLIGSQAQVECLLSAAEEGSPFINKL